MCRAIRFMNVMFLLGCTVLSSAYAAETTAWTIYRSDTALSGYSAQKLPESLELLWTFKGEDGHKSSPIVESNRVYLGSAEGMVRCLRLEDGKKIWEYETDDAVEAPPLLAGGMLLVGNSKGTFCALDPLQGKLKWQYTNSGQILGSANWFPKSAGTGSSVVFGSYDNKVHCLDLTTGKSKWTFDTQNYINGTPAIAEQRLVFGGCDGLLHIVDGKAGTELGQIEIGSYIAGSATVAGKLAFFGHYGNKLLCVDLEKKSVVWSYGQNDGGSPFFSSPALSADRVVIGGRDGFLHCVDRASGKGLWKFRTRGDVDSSPVICQDKVVFGSNDGRVYLVNLKDGSLVWNFEAGSPISTSPAVAASRVIVAAEDGRVYAFGSKK
jgi:outer membrane protein assembly factor BamB